MGQLVHMSNRDGDGWKPLINKRLVSFLFFSLVNTLLLALDDYKFIHELFNPEIS